MSRSGGHGDFEPADVDGQADYSAARQQQGRVPLDEDVNHEREVHHRERAVSAADYESLATPGFPTVGRATVAAVFGVAALVLSAWLLSQIQGPRERTALATVERVKAAAAARGSPEADGTNPAAAAASNTDEPATATPTLALAINFNADAYTIERGECTTLRWQVSGADTVTLLASEVEASGAEEVCPGETRGYTLTANNSGDETSEYFEIMVTEPLDDSPRLGCTPEPNDPCPQ